MYKRNFARPPITNGINILSKSFRGKTSIIIPTNARTKDTNVFLDTRKDSQKIAKKQARQPSTVFPNVKGIFILPKSLPTKLASPSPKESAYIPMAAASKGDHINAHRIIPEQRVTGPKTKRFSSRFLAAASVIADMRGTEIPLILTYSQIT